MPALFGTAQALALLMSVAFVTYVALIVVPFLRHRRAPSGRAADFSWHLFIPCRDEDTVIGTTIDEARATFPDAHVWVIDDASTDDTVAHIVRRAVLDHSVHLVSRVLPEARTGKGEALNAAYRALDDWLGPDADRTRVVVGVIDADGRLAPDALDVCAAPQLFGDARVGSVQIAVRMLNREDPLPCPDRGRVANFLGRQLVRMQDLEFAAPISAIQLARRRTRTVGLGGNGQFSRLSALDSIDQGDRRPWRGALLEDYELSLHLLTAGHRNEYTSDTHVDQEGLPGIRRLLTQRTRWGQGTMQCGKYLPQLWASRNVTTGGALEATYYLLQPWLQLIGSVVYPLPFVVLTVRALQTPDQVAQWMASEGWLLVALYGVLGFGPFVIWGVIYARKCERSVGVLRGLFYGFEYSLFIFTFYVTSWRAISRIVRGRRDWVKTRRNADHERVPVELVVADFAPIDLSPIPAISWRSPDPSVRWKHTA